MKRKIHIAMFMAAGLLLAAACTDDGLDTSENGTAAQTGDEVTVTFSLELEDAAGTNTRAVSDGTGINTLVYAIYDSDGNIQSIEGATNGQIKETVDFSSGASSIDLEVVLVNGQSYTAVFWAQNSDCEAYSTSDLTAVTVDYSDAANNDDTRDAFYAAHEFTAGGGGTQSVSMKRPFAQINVGVTSDDWTAAVDSGITIEKSSVTISNAATSLNLLTGAVSGSETVTFNSAAIPGTDTESDSNDESDMYLTVDGSTDTYRWLSATYVLLSDSQTTLDELNYTFVTTTISDKQIKGITLSVTDLPVQSNYKTNILGSFLTSSTATTYQSFDSDAEALAYVAENGGTITLSEDASLTEALTIGSGKSVTIDLNGHNITFSDSVTSLEIGADAELTITGDGEFGDSNLTINVNGGTLTIEGGTFEEVINCTNDGSLSISDGTFTGNISCSDGGTITITGGTFNGIVITSGSGGSLSIGGCTFIGTSFSVNGGSFTMTGSIAYN